MASNGLNAPIADEPPSGAYALAAQAGKLSKAKVIGGLMAVGLIGTIAAIATTAGSSPAEEDVKNLRNSNENSAPTFNAPHCGCKNAFFILQCAGALDVFVYDDMQLRFQNTSANAYEDAMELSFDISSETYFEARCRDTGVSMSGGGFLATGYACDGVYYTYEPITEDPSPFNFWIKSAVNAVPTADKRYADLSSYEGAAAGYNHASEAIWVWDTQMENTLWFSFSFNGMQDTCPQTGAPSDSPTPSPTAWEWTDAPTPSPTIWTPWPSPSPTMPTPSPTKSPLPDGRTHSPTPSPTRSPTKSPTPPTPEPTNAPTVPTPSPTPYPTPLPTVSPTKQPTKQPTKNPTRRPTETPSKPPSPTWPTRKPTPQPTRWNGNN